MHKPTLVILAAGMASRYGSMKQVQGFGPSNETIMEYSIYDAIRAGFGKVVFIIRKDFEDAFKALMEPKLAGKIKTEYVFQSLDSYLPMGIHTPAERTKPWGTAHALLCAEKAVHENFVVINADDFYGEDGFKKAYSFCMTDCASNCWGIIGYTLSKTLSENGSVSRGVCTTDENHNLVAINERVKIYEENAKIVYEDEAGKHALEANTPVSMNFWCFSKDVFDYSQELFAQFLENNIENLKSEFFIPLVGDQYIKQEKGNIKVVPTDAQWFGVTYKEDAPGVQKSINDLVASGSYPTNLWA